MERYRIELTKEEVGHLQSIIRKGLHSTKKSRSAYVLLNCDEGDYADKVSNETISKVLRIGMRTIDRIKKRLSRQVLKVYWNAKQAAGYMT